MPPALPTVRPAGAKYRTQNEAAEVRSRLALNVLPPFANELSAGATNEG
jgi:hypothetical protein